MDIDSFQYLDAVRKLILALPGVEEYSCYGTPGFRVNKKFISRLREDGETLVVRIDERDKWMKKNPTVYFITDHYLNYPSVLVHLSKIKNAELKVLLMDAWKSRANKKQLKEYEDSK